MKSFIHSPILVLLSGVTGKTVDGKKWTAIQVHGQQGACSILVQTQGSYIGTVGKFRVRQGLWADHQVRADQATKSSVTCVNPVVTWGKHTGHPHKNSSNNFNNYCKSLGYPGNYGNRTYGTVKCSKGALFWCKGYDNPKAYHWCVSGLVSGQVGDGLPFARACVCVCVCVCVRACGDMLARVVLRTLGVSA